MTASETNKVRRFVARSEGTSPLSEEERATDARNRLARQIDDAEKVRWADFVIRNNGSIEELQREVAELWPRLLAEGIAHGQGPRSS